jgi:hypothetical protein
MVFVLTEQKNSMALNRFERRGFAENHAGIEA